MWSYSCHNDTQQICHERMQFVALNEYFTKIFQRLTLKSNFPNYLALLVDLKKNTSPFNHFLSKLGTVFQHRTGNNKEFLDVISQDFLERQIFV